MNNIFNKGLISLAFIGILSVSSAYAGAVRPGVEEQYTKASDSVPSEEPTATTSYLPGVVSHDEEMIHNAIIAGKKEEIKHATIALMDFINAQRILTEEFEKIYKTPFDFYFAPHYGYGLDIYRKVNTMVAILNNLAEHIIYDDYAITRIRRITEENKHETFDGVLKHIESLLWYLTPLIEGQIEAAGITVECALRLIRDSEMKSNFY